MCPKCDPEMAAILQMSPDQYAHYLTERTTREKRAASGWRTHFARALADVPDMTPPDPYAAAIDRLQRQQTGREPAPMPADERAALGGYADAVAARRIETQRGENR
jgi:hypothetical protein